MNHAIALCAAGIVAFGSLAPANAGVRVRVPFVKVNVNDEATGTRVRAPVVRVQAPPELPPVIVLPPAGELPPVVYPVQPQPVVATRVWTHQEFARAFQPKPGLHETVVLHPYTQQPVRIRFQLPNDRFEETEVKKDRLEFEYDDHRVEIRFKRDGAVAVRYDD